MLDYRCRNIRLRAWRYDRGDVGRSKPVEVGRVYDVSLSEISEDRRVTRVQDLVIFVAKAIVGEHLKIKVAEVGNRFANDQEVSRSSEVSLN
jgi:predicted RNA-binding protein with TRAM domain